MWQNPGNVAFKLIRSLFTIPRTPHIVRLYCLAFEVKNQSLARESIAMCEPCTNPLHCPQPSKLRIRLLRMFFDYVWGMPFGECSLAHELQGCVSPTKMVLARYAF